MSDQTAERIKSVAAMMLSSSVGQSTLQECANDVEEMARELEAMKARAELMEERLKANDHKGGRCRPLAWRYDMKRLLSFFAFAGMLWGAVLLVTLMIVQPPVPVLTNAAGFIVLIGVTYVGFRLAEGGMT